MTTSYRNVFLLACCQALLLTNAAGLITMNGLVGYSLVDTKAIATLGATTYVLGSAIATMPMSLWMARVGRRRGFMAGALINIGGCALAVVALWLRSFALYCLATAVIGIYNAVGLQYRFAAAEVASKADRARAISLVLAGGIVGGFAGPAITRYGKDLFAAPFLGSFTLLAVVALVALAVQSRVEVPKPLPEESGGGGRPLRYSRSRRSSSRCSASTIASMSDSRMSSMRTTLSLSTRTPPAAIAPIAYSSWPGTPSLRTMKTSSGTCSARATS